MRKIISLWIVLTVVTSCVSTKSTIKNIDDNAPIPTLNKDNAFVLTAFATDSRYGYDPNFPVNVFYKSTKDENINQQRFLRALAGPNGEKITYEKVDSCCPFPTKRTEIGAGFIDIYEVSWEGLTKPVRLYINMYERGVLMVPKGFSLKK
ncbi:MAG TPA: 2-dehydro-3-deoxyphosphooctonate aldolase [Flavobacterium sp.]|jgi:hypothetical protein